MTVRHRRLWRWVPVVALVTLAGMASAGSPIEPPPEAVRAWEPDVQPILVLVSAALSEQGYDTTELDAYTSPPMYVSRRVQIES